MIVDYLLELFRVMLATFPVYLLYRLTRRLLRLVGRKPFVPWGFGLALLWRRNQKVWRQQKTENGI